MGNIIEENIPEGRFVNPYNFIPLAEECRRERPKINEQDCYTGYFECSMRLLTPLFIPNTSSSIRLLQAKEYNNLSDKEKKNYAGYDFFSYEDYSNERPYTDSEPLPPSNPVIPGSEIRGTVRSVFEAAFNGCMSSVDGDRDLSRRCGEVKKPGILSWDRQKGQWILEECEKARLRVVQKVDKINSRDQKVLLNRSAYLKLSEGDDVHISVDNRKKVKAFRLGKNIKKQNNSNDFEIGYLHKGEYIKGKKYEAVFYKIEEESKKETLVVCEEDVELLKRMLDEYNNEKKNSKLEHEGWYSKFKIDKDVSNILVYYAVDDKGHVYMCPACIGRESFSKKIEGLLKNNGGYQPCSDKNLCPACQIFGMMDKSEKPKTYAYGSKIRITDATLIKTLDNSSSLFEKPIVLPEMGEPRPSAVEFYTESPYNQDEIKNNRGYWTYDYKYKHKYKQGECKAEKDRTALDQDQPQIRGRKYYWHSDVNMKKFDTNQVTAMRQRVRPLKPSTGSDPRPTFQFRIYFEQLNKKQLEQLKWALDFGNPDCAHKMGRGKPLGFGSVQIIAEGLHIRNIDEATGKWETLTVGNHCAVNYEDFFGESGFSSKEIPEALKIMSNWERRPSGVSYPQGEGLTKEGDENANANASHQWFRMNRQKKLGHEFSKVLPTAEEDVDINLDQGKALYKLIEKKAYKSGANVK